VTSEHRYDRTPDGSVWTQTMGTYQSWVRYLEVFDHVSVAARVREIDKVSDDWKRADGDGICFIPVPNYHGPLQYLLNSRQVRRAVQGVIRPTDALILRLPSQLAACINSELLNTGHPYGVEVVGDPYDVFSLGAMRHPLRPFFRWWFSTMLRKQCARSCAAAYVTKETLQHRYPCSNLMFCFSDVELPEEAFKTKNSIIRPWNSLLKQDTRKNMGIDSQVRLIFVGTLAQLYKAPDILIEALTLCIINEGLNLHLNVLGDGKYRQWLEKKAEKYGIGRHVAFLGQVLSGETVRSYLDQADLFVLPSRQEGLPRAMIEAMARGLPCIGTNVGGIPELLPEEDIIPPNDRKSLARKICEVVKDPERMGRMSIRNYEKAKEYKDEILRERRIAFYLEVRHRMQDWLNDGKNNQDPFR